MKALFSLCMATLLSNPILAQGLQDGGQGSGGDEQAEYAISVIAKWNMVAVPVGVSNYDATSVFPTAISGASTYEGGSFVAKDTLDNGPGYWLKFAAGESIPLDGSLIYTDSIPVSAGWNMVGSISDPIASSSVTTVGTTIQSGFFSFNNGYQIASTIEPGSGHWVKVNSSGTLAMSSGSFPKRSVQDTLQQVLASLNTLTITDAAGGSQILYFGNADAHIREIAELPPVPPSGIFDARFASHSMIASGDENILFSSAIFPVEVQWAVTAPGNYSLVIGDKETQLNTTGSIRLTRPTSRIALKIGSTPELPKEFGLSQNYPNPFNPLTIINYQLPIDNYVTLKIYNLLGEEVATLVDGIQKAGYKSVEWHAGGVSTGTYFIKLQAGTFTSVKKGLLVK